ncbi:MAG: hypothetical protein Q8891_05095 [Bacteroidota bacterium]|nr:hypothetical protein [Bacteroidota bacterium]
MLIINQVKQSIKSYDQYSGAEANIYNGKEYIPYIFNKEGSPFFEKDSLVNGWVSYGGHLYQPIRMQYDVARNQVVILNYDQNSKIYLRNEIIDSFHFLDHLFIPLKENLKENLDYTGFYDLLFNGNIRVLAIRQKSYKENIRDNELIRVFYGNDQFYIYKGDKYYKVKNKKEVFKIFSNKKKEIAKRLREQNVKFKKDDFEKALLIAATIYNQQSY